MGKNDPMTRVVTDKQHIEALRELVSKADRVDVAVPYVGLCAVQELLGALDPESRLHLTFAWPIEPGDTRSLCPAALELLLEAGHDVSYVPASHRLLARNDRGVCSREMTRGTTSACGRR